MVAESGVSDFARGRLEMLVGDCEFMLERRRRLDAMMAEAVLHLCPKSSVGKRGWAMVNRGKPRDKAVCAVGHKFVTYAWHVMRGDPTPNRDGEAMFRRKMMRLYGQLSFPTETTCKNSAFTLEAKSLYLDKFHDRLNALAQ